MSTRPFPSARLLSGALIAFLSFVMVLSSLPARAQTAPTLSIDDPAAVTEGDAGTKLLTFTVTLSAASTTPVTVRVDTQNNTATAGSDYTAITNQTLTFAPGETTKFVDVTIIGDTIVEPDESFFVNLSNANGAAISKPRGTGTITNDDTAPPAVTLSIAPATLTIPEGDVNTSVASFTVTLSAATTVPVTVQVSTVNSTATAGSDYVAVNQTLTFSPGQTSKTVDVTINGDTTAEADEVFFVDLSSPSPSSATIATGRSTVTVTNDDVPQISSFTPDTGTTGQGVPGDVFYVQGTQVTITGLKFTGATEVKFNGVGAQFTVVNSTTIRATVPLGATTGLITVTTPGGTATSSSPFTIPEIVPAKMELKKTTLAVTEDETVNVPITLTLKCATQANVSLPPIADVIFKLSASNGASLDTDQVVFPAGECGTTKTFHLIQSGNDIAQGDVQLDITAATDAGTGPYDGLTGTVSITRIDPHRVHVFDPTVTPKTSESDSVTGRTTGFQVGLFPSGTVPQDAIPTSPVFVTVRVVDSPANPEGHDEALISTDTQQIPAQEQILVFSAEPGVSSSNPLYYRNPQTVYVHGVDDNLVDGDQEYYVEIVNIDSRDPEYLHLGTNPPQLTGEGQHTILTNIDNESDNQNDLPGVLISRTIGLVTNESGSTDQFTVKLNSAPTAPVTVTFKTSDPTEGTVSPPSVTFDSTNFDVERVITVIGVDDTLEDGDIDYRIITKLTSSDVNYGGPAGNNGIDPQDVLVKNIDNEQPGITVSPQSLVIIEPNGATPETKVFTVVLNTKPTADVTIVVNNNDPSEATVRPVTLTFKPVLDITATTATKHQWNDPIRVKVTPVDDFDRDPNVQFTIDLVASSSDVNYNDTTPNTPTAQENVTSLDTGDVAGVTVTPTNGLVTTEGGAEASFRVKLNARPTADVTVTFTTSDPSEGKLLAPSASTARNTATLTFTSANFGTEQTIVVKGQDDAEIDGNINYRVTATTTSPGDAGYNGIAVPAVNLVNRDNDRAGVIVTPTRLSVTEAAGTEHTKTVSVQLRTAPSADVKIRLSVVNADGSLPLQAKISTASLTFVSGSTAPQTFTVIAVDDPDDDGDQAFTVVLAPISNTDTADTNYRAIDPADVSGTAIDDDVRGLVLSKTTLNTSEDGTSDTFTARLRSRPQSDVVFTVNSDRPGEGTVSPTTYTFTRANWDTPKTFTVTGKNDNVADGSQLYHIETALSSSDPLYQFDPVNPRVFNADNDTAGIIVRAVTQVNAQGRFITREDHTQAIFKIRLSSKPVAAITTQLKSSDSTEGKVSPDSLTFTPDNYATFQTVTVTGKDDPEGPKVQDGDVDYRVITGQFTRAGVESDPVYQATDPQDVPVVNIDLDDTTPPSITVNVPEPVSSSTGVYKTLAAARGTAVDNGPSNVRRISRVVGVLFRYNSPSSNNGGYWNGDLTSPTFTSTTAVKVNASLTRNDDGSVNWRVDLPTGDNTALETKYVFYARAYDDQGNSTKSGNVTFFIDRTAPVIEITNPRPTTYIPSEITAANGTIHDPISGRIAEAYGILTNVGDPSTSSDDTFLGADGLFTGPYDPAAHNNPIALNFDGTFRFPFPTLEPGRYAFRAFATDVAGNSAASTRVAFTVQAEGPGPTPIPDEFSVGQEYRISLPYMDAEDPNATTTPTLAFSRPPVAADGTENYRLLRLDSAHNIYEPLDNTATLRRGEGYVLRPIERGTTILRPVVDSSRKPTDATRFEITLRRDPSGVADDPSNGYNLIGDPFNPSLYPSVDWFNTTGLITVIAPDGRTFNSIAEASAGDNRVMTGELLRYDPATNGYVQETLMRPFQGYYVRTLVDGVKVVMRVTQ